MSAASTAFGIILSSIASGLMFHGYLKDGSSIALAGAVLSATTAILTYLSYRAFKRSKKTE